MKLKDWIKVDDWKDLIKHLVFMGLIGLLAIGFFFIIYLPTKTNHGDTITVPDVIGVNYDELDDHLIARNLRYEITQDSGYSADLDPLTVLKQFPMANAKVKENRKVYVTLNSTSAPKVKMPNLLDGSLNNALLVLKTLDLKIGQIEYIPDQFFNTVLGQKVDDENIEPGELIAKGTTVDVVLGDGIGNIDLESPRLIGLDEESALIAIMGSGLKIGDIQYEIENIAVIKEVDREGEETIVEFEVAPGEVYKQEPDVGEPMELQQTVNIWIYAPDSVNNNPSLLDQ